MGTRVTDTWLCRSRRSEPSWSGGRRSPDHLSETPMSKHDFTPDEFADRRSRVRAAVAAAGLDWLVAFHPVSIHWLTGSDAQSYQEFQCLLIPAIGSASCRERVCQSV